MRELFRISNTISLIWFSRKTCKPILIGSETLKPGRRGWFAWIPGSQWARQSQRASGKTRTKRKAIRVSGGLFKVSYRRLFNSYKYAVKLLSFTDFKS